MNQNIFRVYGGLFVAGIMTLLLAFPHYGFGQMSHQGRVTTPGAPKMYIQKSNTVPAQNIGVGIPNMPLGGFQVGVDGESVIVAQTVFHISGWQGTGGSSSSQDLTDLYLLDQDGNILAGPVDIAASSPVITFPAPVTYPVGTTIVKLVGTLSNDYANNDFISVSTTPSVDWKNPKGVVSGKPVVLTSATVTGNTMSVKKGSLQVSISPIPVSQTIIAGTQDVTFTNFIFDATQSGEDINLGSMQVEFNFGEANSNNDITNCQLWDGPTALNTGLNIVSGSNGDVSGDDLTFTFDQNLKLFKGTFKTLALRCDTTPVIGPTSPDYWWRMEISGEADDMAPIGASSGQPIVETYGYTTGSTITLVNP